ncbi:MAG: 2-oxo acid dehydrogenase subunit E2 [Dehalococcoidales bacterium]|nr:MAG: 2-oxo acid dehydrogenase subunit E2 [Dehalococcoidales bacterium]
MVKEKQDKFTVIPFPKIRQPVVDSLHQSRHMSTIHALVEIDVTDTRKWVKDFRKTTSGSLSFTAFLTFCLGKAIDENKIVHAYRRRGKLIVYDHVDIAVVIEREIDHERAPIYPHVVKAANVKTLEQIHEEIRTAQKREDLPTTQKWVNLYWYLPGFLRSLLWRTLLNSPYWRMRLTGTVGISAVGMFGRGSGWGIPVPAYNLSITVGGISEKPGVVKGEVKIREYLSVTASFNHDTIDGVPAAQFMQRFRELVESGYGLRD